MSGTTSRGARWRVAVRLASRQVRRTWVSSLLIVSLVVLPIAGLSGAAVLVASTMATPAERATVELGAAQAWVRPAGVPDSDFWQSPSEPEWNGYGGQAEGSVPQPPGEIPADPLAALPAGTRTIPVSSGQVRMTTVAGATMVDGWAGDVTDPILEGRFTLVSGRAPENDREVVVTAATLERAGTRVGGRISLDDAEYTVSGIIDIAVAADAQPVVVFADAARFPENAKWYLPDLALSWADVQKLNEAGIVAFSREVVLDPPPFQVDGWGTIDPAQRDLQVWFSITGVMAAAAAAAGYMVVMLAGAAFAVSARRQQRALAIAASVGADARDLGRVVRLQGTVLGAVGGLIGVVLGVGGAAALMGVIGNGSATMFWGFHVPWWLLGGVLVFAVIVGTVSALAPAREVARSDAIRALRGARRPQKLTAARPLWGSLMIVVGIGITIVSGLSAAAMTFNDGVAYDSPLRWLPIAGIIGGPILAQLGFVLSGRWLLWLTSRGLSRLGLAARLATRDAVANGARTVPAFASIGATVFVGVFAVSMVAVTMAQSARTYSYNAPVGTAIGTLYSPGPEPLTVAQATEAARATAEMFAEVGASESAVAWRQSTFDSNPEAEIPDDQIRAVALMPERHLLDPESPQGFSWQSELQDPRNNLTVLDADDLPAVMGLTLTASQRAAYEGGAALVAASDLVTGGTIVVSAWTERQWQDGNAPSNIFRPWPGQEPAPAEWSTTIEALTVDAPHQPVAVAISPRTAEGLGIQSQPAVVYGAFAAPPTTDQRDRLMALGEALRTDDAAASVWIESGPPEAAVWIVPLLIAMAVLVVGASAVALGLARFERRPDDATLSAVGGTAALRRRIAFWQGLVIVGFGTVAGAAAGVLPPIGFILQSQAQVGRELLVADIPWVLLMVLVAGLSLAVAAVNWLVPPRRPELTRRTAIA